MPKKKGVNMLIPTDSIIADKFDNEATAKAAKPIKFLTDGWDLILASKR